MTSILSHTVPFWCSLSDVKLEKNKRWLLNGVKAAIPFPLTLAIISYMPIYYPYYCLTQRNNAQFQENVLVNGWPNSNVPHAKYSR